MARHGRTLTYRKLTSRRNIVQSIRFAGRICLRFHELMDYSLTAPDFYLHHSPCAFCCAVLLTAEIIQQNLPAEPLSSHFQPPSLVMKESFREITSGNFTFTIVPFRVGPADRAVQWAQSLLENNIFAPAIRPPTVPKHQSRLRFSLTSEHKPEDIEQLIQSLKIICAPADNPA